MKNTKQSKSLNHFGDNTTMLSSKADKISNLTIYPNPTTEAISFEVTIAQQLRGEIVVSDVKGATVYNDKSRLFTKGKQTVVLPIDLTNGIYTVSVIDYDGQPTDSKSHCSINRNIEENFSFSKVCRAKTWGIVIINRHGQILSDHAFNFNIFV